MYVAELIARSEPNTKVQAIKTKKISKAPDEAQTQPAKKANNMNRKVATTATTEKKKKKKEKNNGSNLPLTRQKLLIFSEGAPNDKKKVEESLGN